MNICGVLVHADPERIGEVASGLVAIPGLELHLGAQGGRLIVTIEDTAEATAVAGLAAVHTLPGVVAASLVYHHFEPEAPAPREHDPEGAGPARDAGWEPVVGTDHAPTPTTDQEDRSHA
jgi:nitrate reductase NapD